MFNNILLSRSLKPYVALFVVNAALLVAAVILNSGVIGALFGKAAAYLDPRYNLVFLLGSCLIYTLRRPILSIVCVMVLALLYQIYLIEINSTWKMRELAEPSYFNFARIYSGVLMLSALGAVEFGFHFIKSKFAK